MAGVILLSGPVGAGKTTVAKELVAALPAPVAYIEGDDFWFFIAKSAPNQPRHRSFQMIMRAMTAAALPYARAGYDVVLDFSVPPWFLDTVREIIAMREVPLHFVILRPSEAVCAARAAGRAEGVIKDYAPYSELYADFAAPEVERFTISEDTGDPAAIAARVAEGLEAGTFRVSA